MPAFKSDIYITITTAGKSFRIGGVRLPNNDKAHGAGGGFIAGGSPGAAGCAALPPHHQD